MPDIHPDHARSLIRIGLDETLSTEAIDKLRQAIDDYINEADEVPALVIVADRSPHWENLAAFKEHLKLVRDHHRLIPRVAVVGDNALFNTLPGLLDHFTGAKLRHFPADAEIEALNWAGSGEEVAKGEFRLLDGFPADVIAIDATGEITAQDYEKTLKPLVAEKLKRHDRLKFYFRLGEKFTGYSAGAIWDDARFGFGHLGDMARVALVTDVAWIRQGAKAFAMLMPAELMVFTLAEDATAREWIRR